MATTLPDVVVTTADWVDVYATTGITVGKPVYIINKSSSHILSQVAPTKPVATSLAGVPMFMRESERAWIKVSSGATGIWLKSTDYSASVSVQEI